MCGRFTLRLTSLELQEFFDLSRAPELAPRYNIAPTQGVWTVTADLDGVRTPHLRAWGLVPPWASSLSVGAQMINARSETVATKPSFREAIRHRRCIVPASSYYEWQTTGGLPKQPWSIELESGDPMAFAGLWESWQDPEGRAHETCSILTMAANPMLAEIHDRMPVLLRQEEFSLWLDKSFTHPEAFEPLYDVNREFSLHRTPVSPRVNKVANDDLECLSPVKQQRGLF